MSTISFDNSYARLPDRFYSRLHPTAVADPAPIASNRPLAEFLGIDPDWLDSKAGILTVAGNQVPQGADPIATVYAGHQFGSYNPQLGDGRAILLGEVRARDGQRYDIQLKGAGRTPYSRGGDGRSPLGPVVREYIVSEAMHTLGVPTTRALAAVTTGEQVARDEFLPGAVLARVASSHIRIGTFQYISANKDTQGLGLLVQHVLKRHFPDQATADNPALALLNSVIGRQASLVAKWQLLGFIHGVMNTDNMLLCGETIDYGPCAFMDEFDPDTVFSSIDRAGRYAYRSQPAIAHWNLACLAQALIPALHSDSEQAVALAQAAVDTFPDHFLDAHSLGMAAKLGLSTIAEGDAALIEDLLLLMAEHRTDFTLTFRRLADLAGKSAASVEALFEFPAGFASWLERWQARIVIDADDRRQQRMYRANPVYIPRNHLVQQVIDAAQIDGNLAPFNALQQVLQSPFDFRSDRADFARPPRPEQVVKQTFCGT